MAKPDPKDKKDGKTVVATNRKARAHYEVLEVLEAGIALKGPEVKSMRAGSVQFEGSFARVEDGQLVLHHLHIAPYANNALEEIPPSRPRRLLMRRREIDRLAGRLSVGGFSLVPLEVYFRRGWAKVSLALAKGRRGPDRRETLHKKAVAREMERSFKGKYRS